MGVLRAKAFMSFMARDWPDLARTLRVSTQQMSVSTGVEVSLKMEIQYLVEYRRRVLVVFAR